MRYSLCRVLLGLSLFVSASVQADDGTTSVDVQVFEGIPERSWDFQLGDPTAAFTVNALGLVDVPLKYGDEGLRVDRSNPFLIRAATEVSLTAGEYQFLLRAKNAARLSMNGKTILETEFQKANGDGHESVPEPVQQIAGLCQVPAGHQQQIATFTVDQNVQRISLESFVGGKDLRAELGELLVAVARPGEPFRLLADVLDVPLHDSRWQAYADFQRRSFHELNTRTRRLAATEADAYWQRRHDLAREIASDWKPKVPEHESYQNPIDRILADHFARNEQAISQSQVDDLAFLRRLSLDTVGVIPTPAEIDEYLADDASLRRRRAIDRLLADGRWADHWVSYLQDLLAENPGLPKPKLNNTGPFRFWIYESLLDNKPLDRFATELIMMRGSKYGGGPAGFGMASENDAPMAAKAHIVAKAFLGVEMKCARCHDAPAHDVDQRDTFSLAAMLKREPIVIPESSTVPVDPDNHSLTVEISLKPGEAVPPVWPFDSIAPAGLPAGILRDEADERERAAAILTSPRNRRFAEVLVNRIWHRYLGWGIVDEVDDWESGVDRCPELLEFLAHQLVTHDYDLKHVARLIVSSRFYQQAPSEVSSNSRKLPHAPARRRLTAEQLVDSLALAMGKSLGCEMLTLDPEGRRPVTAFLNLGVPRRAWEMASLSNERDRPALSLPVALGITDTLKAFGWREARQDPTGLRDHEANVLQPLILANGITTTRLTGLSEDSLVTEMALQDITIEQFVDQLFHAVLTRPPSAAEELDVVSELADGYEQRRLSVQPWSDPAQPAAQHSVSWANHLSPEATRIKLDLERAVLQGDPPTQRLTSSWRERAEDVVWALVNSPEFVFVP